MSDRTCPVCGKWFAMTSKSDWQYKNEQYVNGVRDRKIFCSYKCMTEYQKAHPRKKRGQKEVTNEDDQKH